MRTLCEEICNYFFCLNLPFIHLLSFEKGVQNDNELHMKGLADSEIDLHALSSEYEKSKLKMKVVISQQQVD